MHEDPAPPELTLMLNDTVAPEQRVEHLLPVVYEQLRAAAQKIMVAERAGHTLQATALVHEAYIKLVGPRHVPWQNRAHFYAAAAEAMRRIVIDYARARTSGIRGGPDARRAAIDLDRLPDLSSAEESSGFLVLDEAIMRFERVDPQAAAVVRLRYFAGLSIEETAQTLSVSEPTVKRSWAFARGWLREAIESGRV
jgi:RNA polymerase sigma factor (TIGR02999 family)